MRTASNLGAAAVVVMVAAAGTHIGVSCAVAVGAHSSAQWEDQSRGFNARGAHRTGAFYRTSRVYT